MRDRFGNFSPITFVFLGLMAYMMIRSQIFSSGSSITDWLINELYILPGVIIGLTFHEFGHAWVADKLGDNTPRMLGRVSLNPAAHIDIVGLCALLFVGFGWGKPVEIDPRNFRKPRRDEFLVSFAGVVMNLIVAIVAIAVLKVIIMVFGQAADTSSMLYIVEMMILQIVFINFVLMLFNLLPIPPLDGFNIVTEIFDLKKYSWWNEVYRRGFLVLLVFIFFDFSGKVLTPILTQLMNIVYSIL
jgi:Zn-dependent protease